jgi:hypothetical protein
VSCLLVVMDYTIRGTSHEECVLHFFLATEIELRKIGILYSLHESQSSYRINIQIF